MVDVKKARDFVYKSGTLFERAVFDWLFEDGTAERVEQILLCYKNRDNGFGHGFEHDLKSPISNPLAVEYALTVMKYIDLSAGVILDGVSDWVEDQMQLDGYLLNTSQNADYPIAPWWLDSHGQTIPGSIVGNLVHYGKASGRLVDKARTWGENYLTPEKIRENEWLFMAYHAVDFLHVIQHTSEYNRYFEATVENVIGCAKRAPESQYYSLLPFVAPNSLIAEAIPLEIVNQFLDYLEVNQQPDGSWLDQHELPQWYPIITINVLLALYRYQRLA